MDKPRPTVLLVEDNVWNAELVKDMFAYDDLPSNLVHVETGEEALAAAHRIGPVLILMDIRLPDMDGIEVTAQLKKDPHTAHIPIWAFTACAMPEDIERARAAGCESYLTKPLCYTATYHRLEDFLATHSEVAHA